MKIIEVKLDNFKNYDEETFNFASGINAICGPNGSGKTTIIEAIAWVLFDYLPYKNQENVIKVTRSESSYQPASSKIAKAQVIFISDLDKKEYLVYRNTRSQYYILDQTTNERIAEGKREVIPFLRKHFNLSPTANIDEFFTNTIGVPQGTFTSIFLDTATNRKKVFDKVLNIEDYRDTFNKLKDFKSYLKDIINEYNLKLASLKADTDKIPTIEDEIQKLESDISINNNLLEEYNNKIEGLIAIFNKYETLNKDITECINIQEKHNLSIKHLKKEKEENNTLLTQTIEAKNEINTLQGYYESYIKNKKQLKDFEEKKIQLDKSNNELNRLEKDLQNVTNAIQSFQDKLDSIKEIKQQIKDLEPLKKQQVSLEKEKQELDAQLNQLNEHKTVLKITQKELNDYTELLNLLELELKSIDDIKLVADSFEELNKKNTEFQNTISETKSLINENIKMSNQVKGGDCPFLKEPCKNISDGQDLESYFKNIICELEKSLKNYKKKCRGNKCKP